MCAAKESAKLSSVQGGVGSCANCVNYDWLQPPEERRLLRCSKCKFISYCSKECQEEHWVKVHKQHCKYLAEQKVMPQSRHDPASCPGCMKQTEIGLLEMSKADNPILGCPLEFNFVPLVFQPDFEDGGKTSAPIPFKLGEMSGQFMNKAEHTVSLLSHLLHKMMVTKHAAWTIHPEASDKMYRLVSKIRQFIWYAYIHSNPGHWLDMVIGDKSCLVIFDMLALIDEIDEKLAAVKFMDQSVCRLWDTFKLMWNILMLFGWDFIRKDAETMGFPEMSEEVLKLRVTSAEFNDMWMKVLDSMPGKLVPYTDLLSIVCGGQLRQLCFGCSKGITVSEVVFPHNMSPSKQVVSFSNKSSSKQDPFNFQGGISVSLCGEPDCFKKVAGPDICVNTIYSKISIVQGGDKCDNCALPNRGDIHRCTGCLTKLYCGVECRDEDWAKVHKLVCKNTKGQEWKKKGGKQKRRKVGINKVEGAVQFMKNMDFSDELKESVECFLKSHLDE